MGICPPREGRSQHRERARSEPGLEQDRGRPAEGEGRARLARSFPFALSGFRAHEHTHDCLALSKETVGAVRSCVGTVSKEARRASTGDAREFEIYGFAEGVRGDPSSSERTCCASASMEKGFGMKARVSVRLSSSRRSGSA